MTNSLAKCRLCRREGKKLFLKGQRCLSPKCPIAKGTVPPGQHGQKRFSRLSVYGEELREKQSVKRFYGVREQQLKNYFQKASRLKEGTGERFLQSLEIRLDNVLVRGGLVPSRVLAKQLISHGQVLVDGKKVNIPSYQVRQDQIITLSSKGLDRPEVKEFLKDDRAMISPWLQKKAAVVKVKRLPQREEMEQDTNEKLIIEFYSR